MSDITKNVFRLNKVYDLIVDGRWVDYDPNFDSGSQTLWAWGSGSDGRLGDGTTVAKSSPVQVPGTEWNDVSAGRDHALARKIDGTLWAWGSNLNAQLGDETTVAKSSPIQIPGTAWNDVSAGLNFSSARKTDGTLWAWGANFSGQLGDETTIQRSSPIQIPGTEWNDVSTSSGTVSAHTIARKADIL